MYPVHSSDTALIERIARELFQSQGREASVEDIAVATALTARIVPEGWQVLRAKGTGPACGTADLYHEPKMATPRDIEQRDATSLLQVRELIVLSDVSN